MSHVSPGAVAAAVLIACVLPAPAQPLKALILDGQNNHAVWPMSTLIMRQYLEETGLFKVDIARTRYGWLSNKQREDWLEKAGVGPCELLPQPKTDPDFKPDFAAYDVVISNLGFKAAPWPEETQKAFEAYMRGGGGFVVVHAANNCFGDWEAYNRIIGLGGWGGRSPKSGPYVYVNKLGEVVRDPSPGPTGRHGPLNEFIVTMRDLDHPITRGLPENWKHGEDECYSCLRGPAEELHILATAADTPKLQKAGRNEPMIMTVGYHKGRIFHTTLGHDVSAFESVGFIFTFTRGTEWAATGKVTQTEVPDDFPTAEKTSLRKFEWKGGK